MMTTTIAQGAREALAIANDPLRKSMGREWMFSERGAGGREGGLHIHGEFWGRSMALHSYGVFELAHVHGCI